MLKSLETLRGKKGKKSGGGYICTLVCVMPGHLVINEVKLLPKGKGLISISTPWDNQRN